MGSEPTCDFRRGSLWALLILAFLLRLGWGMSRPTAESALAELPDQIEYLHLAQNVLHGQGLSFVDPRLGQRVWAFRMPGYPLFVAACGANVRIVRGVQALLDTGTVLAVFLLARRLMSSAGRRGALLAAALVTVNPLLIAFSGLVLSETLFVAMLMWGMLLLSGKARGKVDAASRRVAGADEAAGTPLPPGNFLVDAASRRVAGADEAAGTPLPPGNFLVDAASRRVAGADEATGTPLPRGSAQHRAFAKLTFVAGALLLALTIYVRPSAILLPSLLGLAAVGLNRRAGIAYHLVPMKAGVLMLALVGIVLTPWALRNERVLHRLIVTDTNAGFTLYDGYNPRATGASHQDFVQNMPELGRMDEAGRSRYLANLAAHYAWRHPGRVVQLMLLKAARTWSPAPLSGQFGRPLYAMILLSYALPLDILVFLGLWRGNLTRSAKVFLLIPAIYLTVVHALTIGSLRYRLPAEPALAVLAACALHRYVSILRQQ